MGDLLKMDLYRMRKAKAFWVCALLAFVCALAQQPVSKLLYSVASMFTEETTAFPGVKELSSIISEPLPFVNAMLVMLSACAFFYADCENGYIKNIAGQTPHKSDAVVSKFIAILPHNLFFMLLGVLGGVIGSLLVGRITAGESVPDAIRIFLLRLLLLQAICGILLLVVSVYRSKPLGAVIAVLAGLGLMTLIYFAIDSGLDQLFKNKSFSISDYMPDQLLRETKPKTLVSIIVSLVTIGVFLPVSMAVFSKKEVK